MLEYEKSDLQQEDDETDMVIEDSENVYTWAQKWSSLQVLLKQQYRECIELLSSEGPSNPKKLGLTNAELSDIRDENKCLELAFDGWEDDLYHTLTLLRSKVREFTTNAESLPETTLRTTALQLENRITRYKSQQKVDFDNLTVEEERIGSLMENASKRFSKWQQSSFLASGRRKSVSSACRTSEEDPRLQEIRAAIMKIADQMAHEGGRTGGWNTKDHGAFLQVVSGCSGRPSDGLIDKVMRRLSSQLDQEDIEEHIAWWSRYNELEADKKALIEQYRERKEQWQKKRADNAEVDLAAERSMARKRKEAEDAARMERKKLIEEWKREKTARMREQELAASNAAMSSASSTAELERRRRERQRITAYRETKLQKEQEERRLKHEREAAARRCQFRERTRFEQRNAEVIRRLASAREERENIDIKAERKEHKIVAELSAPYQNVVSRLYDSTTSHKRRVKAREEEEKEQKELIELEKDRHGSSTTGRFMGKSAGSFGDRVLHTKLTSTPAWRQRLSTLPIWRVASRVDKHNKHTKTSTRHPIVGINTVAQHRSLLMVSTGPSMSQL